MPGLLGLNLKGFGDVGDDDSRIGILGGGKIYLVRRSAVADDEQGIFYVRRQRPDVKRSVFLLYGNVGPAEKDRSQGFRELDPGEALG